MYNGWGSIYWDSSVGDTAAWGLYLQSPPNVGVADQPLVDEFTTNYIVGGEALCLAPNFDNYTSEMGAISGITSPSNGSAEFNGTSDYIEALLLNDYSGYTGLTISTWMYSGDLTSNKTIASNWGDNDNNNFGWLIFTGQFVDYRVSWLVSGNGTAYNQLDSGTNLNENQWYYVTCVWESGSAKIYIDGSLDGSDTIGVPTSIYGTDFPTIIGADFDGSGETLMRTFDGNLANVAIWNRALTSDEINSVMWKQYEEISTSERNGLQAWYSLDSVDSFDWYTYAQNQGAVIEGRTCVDNALNALAQL
jgi:hypothetical protein